MSAQVAPKEDAIFGGDTSALTKREALAVELAERIAGDPHSVTSDYWQTLKEEFSDDEVAASLRKAGILEEGDAGKFVRGKGCDLCRNRGELGRVGVYEVLMVKDELREMIEREAPWSEMHSALTPESYVSMQRYAKYLLMEGVVSPRAVLGAFPGQAVLKQAKL